MTSVGRSDEAFIREIHEMIRRFADGASWSAMSFDLLRTKEVSMEQVFCVTMSQEDFKTISLMLQVLQHPQCIREQVYDVIVEKLDEMKKDGKIPPDNP